MELCFHFFRKPAALVIALTALWLVFAASAQEIIPSASYSLGGQTYNSVSKLRIENDILKFIHSGGVANVPLANLTSAEYNALPQKLKREIKDRSPLLYDKIVTGNAESPSGKVSIDSLYIPSREVTLKGVSEITMNGYLISIRHQNGMLALNPFELEGDILTKLPQRIKTTLALDLFPLEDLPAENFESAFSAKVDLESLQMALWQNDHILLSVDPIAKEYVKQLRSTIFSIEGVAGQPILPALEKTFATGASASKLAVYHLGKREYLLSVKDADNLQKSMILLWNNNLKDGNTALAKTTLAPNNVLSETLKIFYTSLNALESDVKPDFIIAQREADKWDSSMQELKVTFDRKRYPWDAKTIDSMMLLSAPDDSSKKKTKRKKKTEEAQDTDVAPIVVDIRNSQTRFLESYSNAFTRFQSVVEDLLMMNAEWMPPDLLNAYLRDVKSYYHPIETIFASIFRRVPQDSVEYDRYLRIMQTNQKFLDSLTVNPKNLARAQSTSIKLETIRAKIPNLSNDDIREIYFAWDSHSYSKSGWLALNSRFLAGLRAVVGPLSQSNDFKTLAVNPPAYSDSKVEKSIVELAGSKSFSSIADSFPKGTEGHVIGAAVAILEDEDPYGVITRRSVTVAKFKEKDPQLKLSNFFQKTVTHKTSNNRTIQRDETTATVPPFLLVSAVISKQDIHALVSMRNAGLWAQTQKDFMDALGNNSVILNYEKSLHNNVSGDSAGAAWAVAMYSAVKNLPTIPQVVMTGTIEPDGKVGPIGGLKYKIEGAMKLDGGLRAFLLPEENEDDLYFFPASTFLETQIITGSTIRDYLAWTVDEGKDGKRSTAATTLFILGKKALADGKQAEAKWCYEKILASFPNHCSAKYISRNLMGNSQKSTDPLALEAARILESPSKSKP